MPGCEKEPARGDSEIAWEEPEEPIPTGVNREAAVLRRCEVSWPGDVQVDRAAAGIEGFVSLTLYDPVIRKRPSLNAVPNFLFVSTLALHRTHTALRARTGRRSPRTCESASCCGGRYENQPGKYHSCRKCEETSHCLLLSSLVPFRKQPHSHKDGHVHSTLSSPPAPQLPRASLLQLCGNRVNASPCGHTCGSRSARLDSGG